MKLSGKIVFSSGKIGKYDIFKLNLDAGRVDQLTMGDSVNSCPKWSPDGKKIVFISDRSGTPEIWVMADGGSEETRLTAENRWHNTPDWSPDGKHLVFCANYDGNIDVYMMNVDGTNRQQITNYPEMDYAPQFSPDGKTIVFVSKRGGQPGIWICDLSSKALRRLSNEGDRDYAPRYSPDRTKIAFVRGVITEHGKEKFWIALMDPDGKNQQEFPTSRGCDRYVGWSPDGDALIYTTGEFFDSAQRLMVLDLRAQAVSQVKFDRRVLENGIASRPQGLWFFRLLPEKMLRRFYPQSYFGNERSPDWKA